MASYGNQVDDNVIMGTGMGGGGVWALIILIVAVAVLWFLSGGNHRGHGDDHGYGHMPYPGYGFGGNCGPCVQPTFKDESNFEEERNINAKLCCIDKDIWETDRDVWKTACETQKEVHCDGDKTRAILYADKVETLRDNLANSRMENMTLRQEMFTEKKFDQVLAAIGMTNREIDCLKCELPKRPPVFAECVTPNTHDIDCKDRDYGRGNDNYPRRGRGNDCGGCNDGYGFGYAG